MIKYSEMWFQKWQDLYSREYKSWMVEALYVWNNQWQFDFITSTNDHNKHLVTLPRDADSDQMDMAMLQCEQEMDLVEAEHALEEYDEHKFDYLLKPHNPWDSETVWIISIVFLFFSMFFGILWVFVYMFVFFSLITFVCWIVIWIYAISIKCK